MEQFWDKLIVLCCCLPAAVAFGIEPSTVAACLAAVIATALCDASTRPARFAAPLALCAAALVMPSLCAFLALCLYDLAKSPKPASALLCPAALFAGMMTADLSADMLVFAAVSLAVSAILARRSEGLRAQREHNRRVRDELKEASLLLQGKNRDLLERQDYEVRVAVLEERGRIAREIHDNVGHLLTRGVMQTEALQVVHAEDDAVRAQFEQVGATLHEALDTVRASVHNLHDDSLDATVQMAHIIEESGLDVTAAMDVQDVPPDAALCLCAIAREALSNIIRHSDATRVRLELVEHPGFFRLHIADNGTKADEAPAKGLGILSMEERTRSLGGTLNVSARESGFSVTASIPKKHPPS